jgi:O-antigen/teichoic acid export membrane protein
MRLTTAHRLARNTIVMTAALLIQRGASAVVYILIARHLGILAFGQFTLAYTLYFIFQVPAMFGLPGLVVREVAKNKFDLDKYLFNGHLIVLTASLASFGLWALIVHLMGYSPQVIKASYLLGLALVPFAMRRVCESIFEAFERMQFIAYSFALANLAKIGLLWLLLSRGFGLNWVIGLLVMIEGTMLLVEWYFIYRYFPKPSFVIDLRFCREVVKVAVTFLGISISSAIFLRLNVIILSKIQGEAEVGLYNAAFNLIQVFLLITLSLNHAVYPVLSRTYRASLAKFKQYAERAVEFLLSLAFPVALGFFFLAERILLIYRPEFVAAAPVMRVLGWVIVPLCFIRILGPALVASGLQKVHLTVTLISMACLLPISIVCINNFGLMGAGVAALVIHILSFVLYYNLVYRRLFSVSIPKVIWKPIISSLLLAGFLALIKERHGLLVIIPTALALYGAVLVSLNFLFGGPLEVLWAWVSGGKSRPGVRGTDV